MSPGGRANFWDSDYQKRPRASSPYSPSSSFPADDPPTNYRVSAGPKKFSFPYPSHSGGLFGASSSAQIQQELDVAAYEPACETALLTPTTSGSCQQQSSSRHNNLETLSKLDPLLHPALDPAPAVEEPSSPQDNSLVIPSPRVAPPGIATNSTALSIRPTADAPTTGLQLQGLLSINARVQALEHRIQFLEQNAAGSGAAAHLQRSIDAQHAILYKLCSGIDRLATASTTAAAEAAGAATATVSASASLAAAADSAANAAETSKQAATSSAEVLQRQVSPQDSVARAVLEAGVRGVSSGTVCIIRGMAKVANEADLVVALLCHKVLLSDYKCKRGEDGQFQYMTFKSAKRGGLFLFAVEIAWLICNKSMENMPDALQYVFAPILKPVRFCASHARWVGWLAFTYLTVRSVQQGCQKIARLASMPSPPGSPRIRAAPARRDGGKQPSSPTQSEVDRAVSQALAPEKCAHCGATACHGCCGGPGARTPKVVQVPGWLTTPPAAKNKGKKRKVKEEEGKTRGKRPVQKELKPDASGDEEPGLAELEPDLDIKYAKALKNMFRAAGTASVWVVNNFHHVMS